jgi:hypothetical protein
MQPKQQFKTQTTRINIAFPSLLAFFSAVLAIVLKNFTNAKINDP